MTRDDGGGDVFVHQARLLRAARAAVGPRRAGPWHAPWPAPARRLTRAGRPQSDLHAEGFRSLREGEAVTFKMGLTDEGAPPAAGARP